MLSVLSVKCKWNVSSNNFYTPPFLVKVIMDFWNEIEKCMVLVLDFMLWRWQISLVMCWNVSMEEKHHSGFSVVLSFKRRTQKTLTLSGVTGQLNIDRWWMDAILSTCGNLTWVLQSYNLATHMLTQHQQTLKVQVYRQKNTINITDMLNADSPNNVSEAFPG